jgi:hypothetical protein
VFVARLVAPSSKAPASGVLALATCHSRFVRRRFPTAAHAWSAWNHESAVLGRTPGIDAA